jgi:4-amino-4-deoxy-L-arabinose transferase-like glycosyltransferase
LSSIDGEPARGRFFLGLLVIVLVAAGLRLGLLSAFFPSRPVGDEFYYLQTASEIAAGNGHTRDGVAHANWPPAHPFLLSLLIDPDADPGTRPIVKLLRMQALLGTLLVVCTALLGRGLFGARTGLLAGAVAAIYPTFIAFSHFLWSEMLFVTLLTGALAAAVQVERSRRIGWVLLAGVLFGFAGLTREIAILISGGVAVWWVITARAQARDGQEPAPTGRVWLQSALLLCVAASIVLPWTYRNYKLFDRFVPVSSVSWMAIRQGNTFAKHDWTRPPVGRVRTFVDAYYADPDEMGRADRARKEALALIRKEQPTWAFKKVVRNSAMLFNPDSFLFKKISRGTYPRLSLTQIRVALVASILSYVLIMIAGVIGIAAARGRGRRMLALGVIGVVVGLHLFAVASPRYRMPLMPLFVIYGSHALLQRRELGLTRPGKWISAAVLVFFVGWCVPYFARDARSLWERGTYVDAERP